MAAVIRVTGRLGALQPAAGPAGAAAGGGSPGEPGGLGVEGRGGLESLGFRVYIYIYTYTLIMTILYKIGLG